MPARKSSLPRRLPGARRGPGDQPQAVLFRHGLPAWIWLLSGKLIVIEGGRVRRSTQIGQRLPTGFGGQRHATPWWSDLKRSTPGEQLEQAQQGNISGPPCRCSTPPTSRTSWSISIIPALRGGRGGAGRPVHLHPMARDLVRGMDEAWLRNLFGIALVPDAVFYLEVSRSSWFSASSPRTSPWTTGRAAWISACPGTCLTASSSTRPGCATPSAGCRRPRLHHH